MANVLNRITGAYLESVNTPDFDPAEWLINPDLSDVLSIPVMYWKVDGNVVRPMTDSERATNDIERPFVGLDLAGAIACKKQMVNAYRDQQIDGGWIYKGVLYDSDPVARQNMSGTMTLINTGYTLPQTFTWRATNNTNTPFNNQTFADFYAASCTWMETNYHASWWHKAQIDGLSTIGDVISYDFTSGWISGVD